MKKLKEYEKEIQTCSKCGLCQFVCPIYKITGKETLVSRGKFNLLLGLIKGELKYTKNFKKMLSFCLNCKACDDFCPSNIKVVDIISSAKREKDKKIFVFSHFLFFKPKMIILSLIFKFYRFLHISKIIPVFHNFIKKFGIFGKIFLLFDEISKINVKRKKTTTKNKKIKIIYFEGCFTKYLNPSVKNAVLNFLEKNNVEIIQKNFECCGISALFEGKINLFKKLKEKNSRLLKEECDYILCDCATCFSALKEYDEDFSSKVIDFSFLIEKLTFTKNEKITYHLPCHLRKEKNKIIKIIQNSFNNYKEMNNYDTCCGFAGDFSLKHQKIAYEISKEKIKNIEKTNADIILTSCPGCIIGLNKGLIEQNLKKKVLNLAEYIEINS